MSVLLSTFEVESYERWRSVFDESEAARKTHGMTAGRVYRDVANPSLLAVVIEGDLDGMKAYGGSDQLREAEARAGVITDNTSFFEDIT